MGENHGYYRIGWDFSPINGVSSWTHEALISGHFGAEDQGGGITIADLNNNKIPDLIVFNIDNPMGENHGYYRIGWDLSESRKYIFVGRRSSDSRTERNQGAAK